MSTTTDINVAYDYSGGRGSRGSILEFEVRLLNNAAAACTTEPATTKATTAATTATATTTTTMATASGVDGAITTSNTTNTTSDTENTSAAILPLLYCSYYFSCYY